MLSIQNLSFQLKNDIFSGVNLNISRGDFIHLCGSNGSGKTTLLRILAGLIPSIYPGKIHGEVLYEDEQISKVNPVKGICLTGPWAASRLFCRTVWEEISFTPGADIKEAERLLSYFNIAHLRERHPQRLSGGEQQIVLLCAYLCCRPKLLLLDESFAQLSVEMKDKLVKLLKKKHENGKTIIIVEHKLPQELKGLVKRYELKGSQKKCDLSPHGLMRTEKKLPMHLNDYKCSQTVTLKVENLEVTLSNKKSLKYHDFSLAPGELIFIKGPVGSGKSTLMRSLLALNKCKGSILLGEESIKELSRSKIRNHISAVLQSPESQFFCNNVREEIFYTAGRISGINNDYLEEVIDDLKLRHTLGQNPFTLSHGEKKKCQIASAIADRPQILLLDEADAGLDNKSTEQLALLLVKLLNQNHSILLTSHNEKFIENLRNLYPEIKIYDCGESIDEA